MDNNLDLLCECKRICDANLDTEKYIDNKDTPPYDMSLEKKSEKLLFLD